MSRRPSRRVRGTGVGSVRPSRLPDLAGQSPEVSAQIVATHWDRSQCRGVRPAQGLPLSAPELLMYCGAVPIPSNGEPWEVLASPRHPRPLRGADVDWCRRRNGGGVCHTRRLQIWRGAAGLLNRSRLRLIGTFLRCRDPDGCRLARQLDRVAGQVDEAIDDEIDEWAEVSPEGRLGPHGDVVPVFWVVEGGKFGNEACHRGRAGRLVSDRRLLRHRRERR